MRKIKRAGAVLLAVVMTVCMLSGCYGGIAEKRASEKTEPLTFSKVSIEDGNSWETDQTPITIEWFVCYDWFGKSFSPETNLADKKILDATGITIKFTSGDLDKLNLLITTDSLPDVITMDATASQRKLLEDNGLLYPLVFGYDVPGGRGK